MAVATFNGTPSEHVNEALRKIVNDLTGYQYDTNATAGTEYMKLVYPATIDTTFGSADFADVANDEPKSITIILESTYNMDPYARLTLSDEGSQYDPWRICFQTHDFKRQPVYNSEAQETTEDESTSLSMAVYVGTPTTLWVSSDQQSIKIAWAQKLGNNLRFPWATPAFSPTYLSKNAADFIEPLGHIGKTWTHNFDPITPIANKFSETAEVDYPIAYADPTQAYVITGDGPDVDDPAQLFINRYNNNSTADNIFGVPGTTRNSNPVNYRIVLTDHGLFLGSWGENPEEYGEGFSWVVVQRAVNKDTGITRGLPAPTGGPYGNRPLFCVFSVGDNFYKFVVREHDLDIPSEKKDAAFNTEDSAAVLNPYQQQSLTENGEYVVTFINNLNSSRFRYSDELDMVGTVSADVIGGGTTIEVNVYGEDENRTYEAMWPSRMALLDRTLDLTLAKGERDISGFDVNEGDYPDYAIEVYINDELVNPGRYSLTFNTSSQTGKITLYDIAKSNSTVTVKLYGESGGAFGTGMRIVVVRDVPTPNTP